MLDPVKRELGKQLDDLVGGATSIAIITVDEKGLSNYMLPDKLEDIQGLICAVRRCLYDLEQRYEEMHDK